VASLVLIAAAYLLCGPLVVPAAVKLVDQCGNSTRLESAPIVVVGVLTSDTLVRRPVPMHSDPTYPLQLRRLTVRVENILRGLPMPPEITVYYFALAAGFDGPRPLGLWRVGARRILGLRADSGLLRTACDGWDGCTQPLSSGAHPNYRPDPRKPLDYALVDLLFTRGYGPVNDIGFASGLNWESTEPGLAVYAIEKLRHLALQERGEIKSSACETLWIYTIDSIPSNIVHQRASDALQSANCQCSQKPDGNEGCH